MARLIGGIGIYLSVLLLLAYASATHAVEPVIADPASTARPETAKKADMTAFDLASLEARPRGKTSGLEPVLRPEAGLGRNVALAKARRRIRGPALSYHAGDRGPVIELGMFGGTVKPRQRLAHLALDWDF